MSEHPTIGWVGGLSRSGQHLEEAAEKAGCQLEFHDGDVKGNRSKTLREIVRRSQALVIAIGLISHQGALTARAEARQAGIPVVFVKKASQAQAAEAFESLKQKLAGKGALARVAEDRGRAPVFSSGAGPRPDRLNPPRRGC